MGNVIFNGVSSLDLGIQVEHFPNYVMPERDYEVVSVPGRNGDLFIDQGSYKNVKQPYDIAIAELKGNFTELANRISLWLHPKPGYCRLEDSYAPQYYRMAMFNDSVTVEDIMFQGGRCSIEFDCKPQRYLKRGERSVIFTSSGVLKNPTTYSSRPLLIFTGDSGSGRFQIGNYPGSISNLRGSVILDCDLQDAYLGGTNRNSDISLGSGGFPKLDPGNNNISFTGSIRSVEVIPRWWTL